MYEMWLPKKQADRTWKVLHVSAEGEALEFLPTAYASRWAAMRVSGPLTKESAKRYRLEMKRHWREMLSK